MANVLNVLNVLRQTSAITLMGAMAACTAFSGQDVSSNGAGPTDAAALDEGATVGDASASPDGTTSKDGGDSALCIPLVDEQFDLISQPPDWNLGGDAKGSVNQDALHVKSMPFALHAAVQGISPGGFGELYAFRDVSNPSALNLSFSVYLSDWKMFAVTPGCVLVVKQGGGSAQYVRIAHHPDGTFNGEIAGSASTSQAINGLYTTQGFYDVRVEVSGITTGLITANFIITRPDGTAVKQLVGTSVNLAGATTRVDLHCGLASVDFTGTNPEQVNTWVDDIKLTACP